MALLRSLALLPLFALLTGLSAVIGYLWFLALAHLLARKPGPPEPGNQRTRFVFVVPAHNEEKGIARTVASLLAVRYPRAGFEVVVVADNCDDATALRAREAGARCLERRDESARGKGYALRHAFAKLLPEGFDAFVVIDADSVVTEDFLTGLEARLMGGARVVQALDGIANPDASIMTYLFQVGNLIENWWYWEPKERLGLPVFLRGNGMCFSREILSRYPWEAFSITEDTEYGLMLAGEGIRVVFAAEIAVYASQPETLRQAFAQRVRWAAGNSALTKTRALRLIGSGLSRRDLTSLDLGVSLIAGSRPLLLVANLAPLLCAPLLGERWAFLWALALLAGQFGYLVLGVAANGFTLKKMLRLVLSPFYLAWLCTVSLLGAAGFRGSQWIRTMRT